jgi:hypothetical protein
MTTGGTMQAEYDAAMRDIRKGLTFNQGAPSAESRAADAWQGMVRTGDAAQIKLKYRVGKRLKKVR